MPAAFPAASDSGRTKIAVKRIRQAQTARDPKRQPRIGISQQTAQRRAQDKPDAEGRADHAESAGPFLRCDHVRDVGRAVEMLAAVIPEITRPRKSQPIVGASAITM